MFDINMFEKTSKRFIMKVLTWEPRPVQRTYSGGSQGRVSPSQNRKFASPAAASALTPGTQLTRIIQLPDRI